MDVLPPAAFADASAAALYRHPRAAGAAQRVRLQPDLLHPALWLGHQLGRQADAAVPSGFDVLDEQLPGGGWPRRALTELLLPHPGIGEIRLLGACLVATQRAGRLVMLFDPPADLSTWALARLGLDVEQLLVISAPRPAEAGRPPRGSRKVAEPHFLESTRSRLIAGSDTLWALEQALKSGHVGAVLAWLPPRLRTERLRRLQLAAQAHDGPAFVFREVAAAQRPTAAPLRLGLRAAGADRLAVRVLKRRGPPLEGPVHVELPAVLSAAALRRAQEEHVNFKAGDGSQGPNLRAATFVNLA